MKKSLDIKKYIFISVLILGCLALVNIVNKKSKFDIIYKQRKNVSSYNELHADSTLTTIQNFFTDIIDHHEAVITTSTHKVLKTRLRDIENYTNNAGVLNATNKLVENEFYTIRISKSLVHKQILITTKKKYLMRNDVPTYHCLIYDDKARNLAYRFKENDNWYAFSIDSPEDAKERFLDFTPSWSIHYIEAIDFFRK
ncbi:MAG: hypothetical protein AAF090_01275 [Bacteroidota bacterium]